MATPYVVPPTGAPAPSRRRPPGVAVGVGLVVTLLVASLLGVIGYKVRRYSAGPFKNCAVGWCLRFVDQPRIESDLTSRGFTCAGQQTARTCRLSLPYRDYEVDFNSAGRGFDSSFPDKEELTGLSASTQARTSGFRPVGTEGNFFIWVADNVFVGDSASTEQMHAWLRERADTRAGGAITINGFELVLDDRADGGSLSFRSFRIGVSTS